MTDYRAFLEAKTALAEAGGFDIDPAEVHPALKPHQRDIVCWAVRGGRRAIFAAFGLGKTLMQLEVVRLVLAKSGGERGLIVLPLGVRQEFTRDAAMLGLTVTFIRSIDEASAPGIYMTNYETVRDGKLDPRGFTVVSLDEAAVLRGFGGTKTFREFMRLYEGSANYRFVATATPSPNEYIELLSYAAFLDVMDVGQAKTRFFRRDSEHADALSIHPHKEREFWLWVSSWAMFIQKPSDLGHSDDGYELPPMDVRWHEIPAASTCAGTERDGQSRLFANTSLGVTEAAREKRESMDARVARMLEVILDGRERAESHAAPDPRTSGVPAQVPAGLLPSPQAPDDSRGASGEAPLHGVVSPEGSNAHSKDPAGIGKETAVRALGRSVPRDAGEAGLRVPDLPTDADRPDRRSRPSHDEGPGNSLPEVQHGAGHAGGQPGATGEGSELPRQFVVWCDLNDEQRAIEAALSAHGITFSSLYGNQPLDERERLLAQWRAGETSVFLSKPSMYGAGVNLQQCHRMVFAGIAFKFYQVVQAVHRIYRFLQTKPVRIDLIYTEAERDVKRVLERKWAQHVELVDRMGQIIREYGLSHAAMASSMARTIGVERLEASGEGYRIVRNDSVEETRSMDADSIDLILTSIPFATQYEYTPSYNDFGHTEDNEHFWRQMDFLTPELLRVLRPGRVAAVHVKDRVVPGGLLGLGFQTVAAFHAEAIFHYQRHGFAFLGMKTIVTDVVRENNQTYRLGWTEQCKDGSRMGCGMPEYLLLFRRPPTDRSNGYGDVPVVKAKKTWAQDHWENEDGYSRARWQLDAHGFERSSGNRLLSPEDLVGLPANMVYRMFREHSLSTVYDFEQHVACGEALEAASALPPTFMLLPPQSWHPDVWTDVARMRTLNMLQERKGREMHLCPLQFDIVDRVIEQFTMPGETVFDPFGGLMTVPYCAVKAGRRAVACELSEGYFRDGARYVEAAVQKASVPTLFDLEATA